MTQRRSLVQGGLIGPASDDLLLNDAVFGTGLLPEAEHALNIAALSYSTDQVAERHLSEAARIAPDHAAVLIGRYRYYFYKGRLDEALQIACICLVKASRDLGLQTDWRLLLASDAEFGSFDAVLPRFYMFTLKAYAYLQLRLGDLGEGRDAVLKLLELDPTDKVNARLLLDVLQRAGFEDV